jgi:hypothetical protein
MIVTKNTFTSYSLARGTAQFQLILLILTLYTLIAIPIDGITEDENLEGLSLSTFKYYTRYLIPLLIASLMLVNVFTDFLGFESMKYWASIMGLCLLFVLFYIIVTCRTALFYTESDVTTFCYVFWLRVLTVSMIGQIVSGVIFMMIRGLVRTKVELRTIPETKCYLETDALTANKEEINLFSSFMIPFLVLIKVPRLSKDSTFW